MAGHRASIDDLQAELRQLLSEPPSMRSIDGLRTVAPSLVGEARAFYADPDKETLACVEDLLRSAIKAGTPSGERQALHVLLGLTERTHARAADRQSIAGDHMKRSGNTVRQPQFQMKLAKKCADAVRKYLDDPYSQTAAGVDTCSPCLEQQIGEQVFIVRNQLANKIAAFLRRPGNIMVLFGEAGNGKTFASVRAAADWEARGLMLMLRQVLTRRDPRADIYEDDLRHCLRLLNVRADGLTLGDKEARFRQALAEHPGPLLLILDDATTDDAAFLVPEGNESLHVLVTSRSQMSFDRPRGESEHVGAFTEEEARSAARLLLPDCSEDLLALLVELVARRPCAIQIAARLVLSGNTTADALVGSLQQQLTSSLSAGEQLLEVADRQRLENFYREVWELACVVPGGCDVLRAFLWLSNGYIHHTYIQYLLTLTSPKPALDLERQSGFKFIKDLGLLHDHDDAIEINGLTLSYLRRVAANSCAETITAAYEAYEAIIEGPPGSTLSANDDEAWQLLCNAQESEAISTLLSYFVGDVGVYDLSFSVWLLWQRDCRWFSDRPGLTVCVAETRYYEIWQLGPESADGQPTPMDESAADLLRAIIFAYRSTQQSANHQLIRRLRPDREPPEPMVMATLPSKPDGHRHEFIDIHSPELVCDMDWRTWTRCGELLVEVRTEDPLCPRCEALDDSRARDLQIWHVLRQWLVLWEKSPTQAMGYWELRILAMLATTELRLGERETAIRELSFVLSCGTQLIDNFPEAATDFARMLIRDIIKNCHATRLENFTETEWDAALANFQPIEGTKPAGFPFPLAPPGARPDPALELGLRILVPTPPELRDTELDPSITRR